MRDAAFSLLHIESFKRLPLISSFAINCFGSACSDAVSPGLPCVSVPIKKTRMASLSILREALAGPSLGLAIAREIETR